MNIPEINEIRRNGNPAKAFELCGRILDSHPGDRHARIAMGQCIKQMAERLTADAPANEMISLVGQLADLRLHELGDVSVNGRMAWNIKAMFEKLRSRPDEAVAAANQLLPLVKSLVFAHPHKNYTLLVEAFMMVRGPRQTPWTGFVELMDWWGFENFRECDYDRITTRRRGQTIASVAERAISAYSHSLEVLIATRHATPAQIDQFVQLLSETETNHPDLQYIPYQRARILLAAGRHDSALADARRFVRGRTSHFWAWELLAQVATDSNIKLACLTRALTCGADPKFSGRVRCQAASLMAAAGHFANARHEIETVVDTYSANGWHIPATILRLTSSSWFKTVKATGSNSDFYKERHPVADNFLFEGIPATPIIITRVNREKNLCTFVTADRRHGAFFNRGHRMEFRENQILTVRFPDGISADRTSRIALPAEVSSPLDYENKLIRRIDGELRMRQGSAFGFVDDVYIAPSLIDSNMKHGSRVSGWSALSYSHRRDQWGWHAVSLRLSCP